MKCLKNSIRLYYKNAEKATKKVLKY
jgi:hypothetical protein